MKSIRGKNIKWWIEIILCVVLFAIIFLFSYEKMIFVIKGVKIEAQVEQQDDSSVVTVYGKAIKATRLTLNGREIFIDGDGNFSEKVAILSGLSIITIRAEDKFGKVTEKKFKIVKNNEGGEDVALKNY